MKRICHAVVRFDNVTQDTTSEVLARTRLPTCGDILEHEYLFMRSVSIQHFEKLLSADLADCIGCEVSRLLKIGCRPILHLDFNLSHLSFFMLRLDSDSLRKLSRGKRKIEVRFPSEVCNNQISIEIPSSMIRLLNHYEFSLEIV